MTSLRMGPVYQLFPDLSRRTRINHHGPGKNWENGRGRWSLRSKTVVLVAFYNVKALGVRYLETALRAAGWNVVTVYFKRFNSRAPSAATAQELALLAELVEREGPVFVGLSVMSSMYLETVEQVIRALKGAGETVACGGAYASLEPKRLLTLGADYVLRLDGEKSIVALAETLKSGGDPRVLDNLCYLEGGGAHCNPIAPLEEDLDVYGQPTVNSPNAYLIDEDRCVPGDPQLDTLSYEVIASRGCPFTCSYCACQNLRRLYPAGSKPIRFRSVDSVMAELEEARRQCKRLVFVHFYDEIFPNTPGWVEEFAAAYKQRIGLPFSIWTHPKIVDGPMLKTLKDAGLVEVIMGIQSGSPYIRKDIFHRYETNEDVARATRVIAESGVFWASYDFMLLHPFETADTMRETYELVKGIPGHYELQMHGLNFLPATDIVPMAVEGGFVTAADMEATLYAPMAEQFSTYWHEQGDEESRRWYALTYLWQFPRLRRRCLEWEDAPGAYAGDIDTLYEKAKRMEKRRYLRKKAGVVLRRLGVRKHR